MKRRRVRAKRGSENRTKLTITSRVKQAFENWSQILNATKPTEIEKRLTRFLPLRKLVAEVESAAVTFVELKYGEIILKYINDGSNSDTQISYLFALSDLVDVDDSGVLGSNFIKLGMLNITLSILRNINESSEKDNQLKTAGLCALSSLCLHDLDSAVLLMDHREVHLLDNILQVKSMMHLHSRVINFINNLYVCGKFQDLLSQTTVPSLMTLLMYNVTNHIKSCKQHHEELNSEECEIEFHFSDDDEDEDGYDDYRRTNISGDATLPNKRPRVTSRGRSEQDRYDREKFKQDRHKLSVIHRSTLKIPKVLMPNESEHDHNHNHNNNNNKNNNNSNNNNNKNKNNNNNNNNNNNKHNNHNNNRHNHHNVVAKLNVTTDKLSQKIGNQDPEGLFDSDNSDYEIDSMYDDDLYNEFIESACYLLGNLTTSVEICKLVEQYSIIDIMTLLFHNTDTTLDVLTSVIKCLGNLAHVEENKAKLMESNILPIALKLIKLNIDDEMKAQITLLLANMAGYGSNGLRSWGCTQTLVDGGVIESIAALLNSNNQDYQRFATLALANLSIDIAAIPRLMHTQSFKRIVELCYSPNIFIQRQAVRVLNSVAAYPTGVYWDILREVSAIPALQHVISTDLSESSTKPSAHDLAKTALTYIRGEAIMSLPLDIGNVPSAIYQLHPMWKNSRREEGKPMCKKKIDVKKSLIDKAKGNESFGAKNFRESIIHYTSAIGHDPNNYTLYSNRAAAYIHLRQWELALQDSEVCADLEPDFVKGHFRKGKALVGLEQYSEAVEALTTALKLKKNNKEVRDALQYALIRKKDRGNTTIPIHVQKLSAEEIMSCLALPEMINDTAHLLGHLFNLFKRYYYPSMDENSQDVLLGRRCIDSIVMELHIWSTNVNLEDLVSVAGVSTLLFETELMARHIKQRVQFLGNDSQDPESEDELLFEDANEDLSCYQFSFFVTTVLARLVIQGHSKYGLRALKRLIVLDSNKLVRDSIGSQLTQATLQVSGYGGWGLPKMPTLHHLFVHYGGLRCIALDSDEDDVFKYMCSSILDDVPLFEWQRQSLSIIQTVIAHFVIPSLDSEEKEIQSRAIIVFSRVYSIPEVRKTSFPEWGRQHMGNEFGDFCSVIVSKTKILLRQNKFNEPQVAYDELGIQLARMWIALPSQERYQFSQ